MRRPGGCLTRATRRLDVWAGAALFAAGCAGTSMPGLATLDGAPPVVIAPRGASGYLAEETLEAYQKSIEMGASVIEFDVLGANYNSSRHWELMQTTAVFFPTIIVQASDLSIRDFTLFVGRCAVESSVNTISVAIFRKQRKFPRQVTCTPERYLIEILSPYCADQCFDEWM